MKVSICFPVSMKRIASEFWRLLSDNFKEYSDFLQKVLLIYLSMKLSQLKKFFVIGALGYTFYDCTS